VERDLALAMGVHGAPILARVARSIGQMPKYTVGHLAPSALAGGSLRACAPGAAAVTASDLLR
jgi:hypothetical protein